MYNHNSINYYIQQQFRSISLQKKEKTAENSAKAHRGITAINGIECKTVIIMMNPRKW